MKSMELLQKKQNPIISIYWVALCEEDRKKIEDLKLLYNLSNNRLDNMRANFLQELLTTCQVNLVDFVNRNNPNDITIALCTAWVSIIDELRKNKTQNLIFSRVNPL